MKERSRINLQLAEKVDELATFYCLSSALQGTMELDGRLRTILKWAAAGGGFDRATLLLIDDERGMLNKGLTTDGRSISVLKGVRVALNKQSAVGPREIMKGSKEALSDLLPPEVLSNGLSVSIPLIAKGKPVGVIVADNSESKRPVTKKKSRFLEVLANLAALAIENARLHSNLKSLAVKDSLTGLFNRRRFDEQLQREIERAERYDRPLSLVMIDLDHFKHYNDVNGHPAGDRVLVRVARILRQGVRVPDTVARYGGDEFVALLPETGEEGALAFGERIRKKVEKGVCSDKSHQPAGPLTICLGIASYPEDAQSAKGLVEKADRALYLAKHGGKNRVSSFEGDSKKTVDKRSKPVVK